MRDFRPYISRGSDFDSPAQKKIAVAVQRGVNDYGDRETDVTRTQHRSRQLVAIRIQRGSAAVKTVARRHIDRQPVTTSSATSNAIRLLGLGRF